MGLRGLCRVASRRVACCSIQPIRWASSRARLSGSDIQSVAPVHGYLPDYIHSGRDAVTGLRKASELVEMASELVKTRLIHAQALGAVYRSQLERGLKTVTYAHCMSVI